MLDGWRAVTFWRIAGGPPADRLRRPDRPGRAFHPELKGKKAHLACGRFEANISGIDAEDFPPIPTVSGGANLAIGASALKEAIQQVVFAAAPDDSRPVLAGVLLTVKDGKLTLAAADGFRLAVRPIDLGTA